MPASIQNLEGWTLRKLIQNTYTHMRNRFEYKERDVLRSIKVKKVSVYDNKGIGEARTKFIIQSFSYPQYRPYISRSGQRQRKYKHEYDVTIQLEELSIDTDKIRIRTGADMKWDFSTKGKSRKDSRGRIIEGTNIKRGINGDFFFRLSYIRKQAGILFGRNFANGPPLQTNPHRLQFLTKHELMVLEILINKGVLK
jgi:hypothetical protein